MRARSVLAWGLLILFGSTALVSQAAEKDSLDGAWSMIAVEVGGKKLPSREIELQVVIIKDGVLFMRHEGPQWCKFTLDTTHKPYHIDLSSKFGDDETVKTELGICELEDKTLKICCNQPDGERPTEFTTAEGSQTEMMTLRRVSATEPVKPDTSKPKPIPVPKDETPKAAMLRYSQISDQLDEAALIDSFEFTDREKSFVEVTAKSELAVVRICLLVREKYGRRMEDALLHALGPYADDDIRHAEYKVDGDHCSVQYQGDPDESFRMIRVNGVWKVDANSYLEDLSEDAIGFLVKDVERKTTAMGELLERIKKGELKTPEEIILETTRVDSPPDEAKDL